VKDNINELMNQWINQSHSDFLQWPVAGPSFETPY